MKIKILIILLLTMFCTGCYNYHELSDFAIVTGIGVDKDEERFKVSVMIANASNVSSSSKEGDSSTTVITGTGKTITEAITDIEKIVPKDLYTGHLSAIVISDKLAYEGLYDILSSIMRNPESIKKLFIIIAKESESVDILKTLSPLENFPTQNIVTNLKTSNTILGTTTDVIMSTFIANMLDEGIENILPTITIDGNKNEADNVDDLKNSEVKGELKLNNLSIFKNDKLIGYVDEDISKGINIINNQAISTKLFLPCYKNLDKYLVLKIDTPKTKINLDIENNKLKYTLNVTGTGSINETNCKLDLNDPNVIENINNSASAEIYDLINNSVNEVFKYKSDIFGLGNILYKKDPKLWKKLEKDWNNNLDKLDIKVESKINIKSKGSLKNTLKDELDNAKD